jgi:serine/threonine protein kinase
LSSSIVKYPFVRLADFGLSTIKLSARRDSNYRTSLGMTGRLKGTPVYCAPEMLINPFNESGLIDRVARPSRKTDMYAFGLLAWEILCEEIPFKAVLSETALCSKVHQGARPDLNLLPTEIPPQIRDMISACWDRDRTVRKSAEECLNILKDFLPIDRSN